MCGLTFYFAGFEEAIIKTMAAIVRAIPMMMLTVMLSPNANAPTSMAVTGSNTPSTEAFVAPIRRVDAASVAVDIMVGRIARQTRLVQDVHPDIPCINGCPAVRICMKKHNDPARRA